MTPSPLPSTSSPLPSRRWLRAAVILGAGWLVLEFVLAQLIAARIGWGATVLLVSIKGGIGILMVGALALGGLKRLGRGGGMRLDLAFGLASAILITLPGLVPTLLGIALFAPSLRCALLRRFRPAAQAAPRQFDLAPREWRELRSRRIARRTKARLNGRQTPEQSNTLEAKPPSV